MIFTKMRTLTKMFGIFSLVSFVIGAIMKNYHIKGADQALVLGLFVFVAGFSPLFLREKVAEETRIDAKISYAVFFISSIMLLVAAQLTILKLPGAGEMNYISLTVFITYIVFFSRSQDGRKLRIRKDRQLAAIVFTDIVGFTRMMGEDEDKGLLSLEQNRKIHKKWVRKYRGRWLKEMGDGAIVIFYTVTEALLCAIEIQKEIRRTQEFEVRMGVHISEIVFTDNDAFGDGMNLASRISNQAKAGEICFSEVVYQNIINRENLSIEQLGLTELKNVNYPIQLYAIKPSG